MYKIDFEILIKMLIPSIIRKPKLTALLIVLFYPFKLIWDKFNTFREFIQMQLNCTGQLIYLERLLNLMFNSGNEGIIIIDGQFTYKFYLSNLDEGLSPVYFQNLSESGELVQLQNASEYIYDFDFLISIPSVLYAELLANNQINRLIAIVNKYTIAGKTFNIISN